MARAVPEKFKDRIIFGHPTDAWKVKSDVHWAAVADIKPFTDLELMCEHASAKFK
jgi:hypothetical protein